MSSQIFDVLLPLAESDVELEDELEPIIYPEGSLITIREFVVSHDRFYSRLAEFLVVHERPLVDLLLPRSIPEFDHLMDVDLPVTFDHLIPGHPDYVDPWTIPGHLELCPFCLCSYGVNQPCACSD